MSELILDVRLDGYDDPIGVLKRDEYDILSFRYSYEYLKGPNPVVLSLSMPIQEGNFSDALCRAFFGNLLQERDDTVARVMDREGLDKSDIAGLLFHLGKDCPGAISVLDKGSPPAKVPGNLATDYELLAPEMMDALVKALYEREPLPDGVADPSPIAGVQGKIALTIIGGDQFAQPLKNSGAPTTHILKVSNRNRPNETILEAASMVLSKSLGILTAEVKNIKIAGINTLLVTRYDRVPNEDGLIVRVHQEDFAQAIGLPSTMKYERDGRDGAVFSAGSISKIINLSIYPAEMRRKIIEATLFDLIIGNNDGHAKNFSLIHNSNGAIELAPRYDLVPTRLFDGLTDQLAYHIGNATTLEEISAEDFGIFMFTLGIEKVAAQERLRNNIFENIVSRIADQIETLDDVGQKKFADLIASNIRQLSEVFDLHPPKQVIDRDAAIQRGGGWLMSS